MRTPDHLSLICISEDASFGWCRPPVAYFKHDDDRILQTLLRWVKCMAQDKPYTKQTLLRVEWVEGGTLVACKILHGEYINFKIVLF